MAKKKTLLERWAHIEPGLSLGQWVYDRLANNWALLFAFFSGGGMSYLAAISDWLAPWGPVGWGAVGLGAFLASLLGTTGSYRLYASARKRTMMAEYARKASDTANVNPLAPTHQHERIRLADFYSPYFVPTKNVRFEDCELHGPANLILNGGMAVDSTFGDCEIIIFRKDRKMLGGIMFENCQILRCHVFRATICVDIDYYNNLPEDMRRNLRVVSDGRVGDV